MKRKKGVSFKSVVPQVWYALGIADKMLFDLDQELVVTSLEDSVHGKNSYHYSGRAADLRIRTMSPEDAHSFYTRLKYLLDRRGFDVVLESDHIHIEWDPKTGDQPWLQEVA